MKLLILVITTSVVLQIAEGAPLTVNCSKRATAVEPIGAKNGELIYLDRHNVGCKSFEFLNEFRFVRSDKGAFYSYTCCFYTV
jgi:hypothetical protein